ncbi:adenine deaminase [Pontibacillus halophilus JSM 076056 = DSM 19796]|uniref:adenine deaminase n=1 Tax=Pontibacillus halophilus JSM 076056 = DSM 19796 TaxID=1385510 RepID=A0A0A5I315_9BACI|nr:adenine deaminase C-terminal domain-containing protein [Pontibacillus halophilus]KGX90232.1 adenine deaminase [Pontibacillus halophilus JSM 076056 = DSM 19796]
MSYHYPWRNRKLREHTAVLDGDVAPTYVLTNATYLNVFLKQWLTENIWIYEDRIVYVGEKLPKYDEGTTYMDCSESYIVPGYIEPHAHPFQLYNPHSLQQYASRTGTTSTVNDNISLLFLTERKKAFSLIEAVNETPFSLYWWCRFDSQSHLQNAEPYFNERTILSWLNHPYVVQGGELTSWPDILKDDDRALKWMQEAKVVRKQIEGHFPGASERTLTKMKLLGTDGDHEAMTGQEVYERLRLGYTVALRHSSIRPDLPKLLEELKAYNLQSYDRLLLTTDGSTPSFYRDGLMNVCIKKAIEGGVPIEDAYAMATYNVARHFTLDHLLGSIGPGRVAHLNFLSAKDHPTPHSVMAKGQWVVKDDKVVQEESSMDWDSYGLAPLNLQWDVSEEDLTFSIPMGLELMNNVLMKPYAITTEYDEGQSMMTDEAFIMLLNRDGRWKVNTMIKGFTDTLGGLVSSYSNTGDFIFIGKKRSDMLLAFQRMKELGGGIVLAHEGEIVYELPLPIGGMMSDFSFEVLMKKESELKEQLAQHGYSYSDPVYTLLFLSSTHLPYIRITPKGIVHVKKKEVLFPAIMR